MSVDPSLRDEIAATIRKQYDESTIMAGDQMPAVSRIPTGSLGLDYITGGGIPRGRWARLWGGTHSGKSLVAWKTIKSAQNYGVVQHARFNQLSQVARMSGDKVLAEQYYAIAENQGEQWQSGLNCCYVNVENQYDPLYVGKLGIDTKQLEIVNETRIESIGAQLEMLLQAFHVIVIDSCSMAISLEELSHDDGIYGNEIALDARKWKKVFTWLNDRMSPEHTIIYITHSTTKIGLSSRRKFEVEKAPGGKRMEFVSSMTLHFVGGSWLYRRPDGGLTKDGSNDDTGFGRQEPDGREIIVHCDKSRISRGDRTALLHYDYAEENFDPLHEYAKLGRFFKILKRTSEKSSWYELPDGRKTQQLRQYIAENETLRWAIEDVTLRCSTDPAFEQRLLSGKPA